MPIKSFLVAHAMMLVAVPCMAQVTSVDLSKYTRVGRYNLPEPTRTTAPANSLLAREASAVAYNKDTGTLFVVGDSGTSIVQVSKTGVLINSMTLAQDTTKPSDTYFYDTEGLAYLGNGKFILLEERYRQANLITYTPNTTLGSSQVVKLGTTIGNVGTEGITTDPFSGGYVVAKETSPEGVFQTTLNFANGTASNGSASTTNSANLFDPDLLNLNDIADVYSLSNLNSLASQPDFSHLLVLSQESGKIVETDRSGNILSSLTLQSDAGNPLNIANQHHEGLTMDDAGNLYVVSEQGGGDVDHPQLWVYAPTVPEPTAIGFLLVSSGYLGLKRRKKSTEEIYLKPSYHVDYACKTSPNQR